RYFFFFFFPLEPVSVPSRSSTLDEELLDVLTVVAGAGLFSAGAGAVAAAGVLAASPDGGAPVGGVPGSATGAAGSAASCTAYSAGIDLSSSSGRPSSGKRAVSCCL